MTIGVIKEAYPGERRVALVAAHVPNLKTLGADTVIESGAGLASGIADEEYTRQGATIVSSRAEVLSKSDILLTVRNGAADPDNATKDLAALHAGQMLIGFLEPYHPHALFRGYVEKQITTMSIELMPRITRAQSMDALSSMANLAGYRAVILAAEALPMMFPMMMTAAGTIVAAKILVIGAGVAGLQAIATARRLGGIVSAYDVRPEVKEQVLSLGARFVELDLTTAQSGDSGGYAQAMDEEFYRRQRELMATVVSQSDVVITTAAIPGKTAPVLITEEMVRAMHSGAVIVDIAAERGGNCALTVAGETVVRHGVTIAGPVNIPANIPHNASRLYSKNLITLLESIVREGQLALTQDDEIVAATLVTHQGSVPNEGIRTRLEL